MAMFYNPKVMDRPGTTLMNIHKADPNDKFISMRMRLLRPYESREDALKDTASCRVLFYENGELYEASRIGSWEFKPCVSVACSPGINWDTYYATSIERLSTHLSARYPCLLNFNPQLNNYGLYEIQVHYDGICR
jgi:hypothetical protein